MADEKTDTFEPLRVAASKVGVPMAWLRAEAAAGRVPHLRAGRRILFDVAVLAAKLRERAHTAEGNNAN